MDFPRTSVLAALECIKSGRVIFSYFVCRQVSVSFKVILAEIFLLIASTNFSVSKLPLVCFLFFCF